MGQMLRTNATAKSIFVNTNLTDIRCRSDSFDDVRFKLGLPLRNPHLRAASASVPAATAHYRKGNAASVVEAMGD